MWLIIHVHLINHYFAMLRVPTNYLRCPHRGVNALGHMEIKYIAYIIMFRFLEWIFLWCHNQVTIYIALVNSIAQILSYLGWCLASLGGALYICMSIVHTSAWCLAVTCNLSEFLDKILDNISFCRFCWNDVIFYQTNY